MHEPTADCPAWIRADDGETEQLFRDVVAACMRDSKIKRMRANSWQHETLNISDRD
jgi:hypothetical protein